MPRCLRVFALGAIVGCAGSGEGNGPAPRAGAPCNDGSAARCGKPQGSSDELSAVLACEDGTWTQLLSCGENEHCYDDASRGAVVCTDINDEIVYGEFDGPCEVEGAAACSTDRRYAMTCMGGSWAIETNCSTEVLDCTLLECDDPDGCIGCE